MPKFRESTRTNLFIQQQKAVYDCVLFVIATVVLVASGEAVRQVSFNQQEMRAHLVECLPLTISSSDKKRQLKVNFCML